MGGRLVGREPALAVAVGALDEALGGAGRLLLVTGDAGIGKTALVREVAAIARGRRARIVWTASPPGGGAPVYWPWSQVLRALDDRDPPHPAAGMLSGRGTASSPDDATARFELHQSVVGALGELAADGAVVVLDDLHWADRPSLELLDAAARQIGAQRLLVLGTYRDLEAPPALERLAAQADGLTLGGLDAAAVSGLVTTITGTAPAGADADRLRSRTAGNPLFVRELARLMVARGAEVRGDAGLPATVADTLRQRLTGLTIPCRRLLDVVAVADSADSLLLAEATTVPIQQIGDLLVDARMARVLVEPVDDPGRPFVHDLFREAVLAELAPDDRRRWHRAVADALIRRSAADGAPPPAARVAAHLTAALPGAHGVEPSPATTLAVTWLNRAAAEATARLGHEEAVRLYRQALDLTDRADPALLLALAGAELRAGDPATRATYLAAAEAARATDDQASLAAAALGLHQFGARGDHDTQVRLIEEAARSAPDGTSERALLLAALARERRHANDPAVSWQRTAEEAVSAARELAAPQVLAACLLALHDAVWAPGSARARLPILDEMSRAAEDAADVELAAQAEVLRAACLLELNDRRGLAVLAEYCRRQRALGHARGRWEAASRAATLELVTGAVEESARDCIEAFTLGQRIGVADAAGVHGTLRWPLSLFTGDRLALVETMGQIDLIPLRDAFTAAALRTEGDPEQARRLALTLSMEVLPTEKYDLEFEALAAESLAAGGRNPETERCYRTLQPHAGTNVVVGGCASFWGPVDLYLGHLAVALEEPDAARAHYDTAARMAVALGAPRWAALAGRLRDEVPAPRASAPAFARSSDVWTVTWQGRTEHLRDSKGMRDLAELVAHPGTDLAAVTLAGGPPVTGADPVLDDRAKAEYRKRIDELDREIDDARLDADPDRAERAEAERTAIIAELSAAVGLGRRDRRLGDDAERARKAVTARIRDAINRIRSVHPELGEHLADAVRTGSVCGYHPG